MGYELNEDVQDSYNSHSDDVIRDVPLRDIRNITYGHHATAVTQLLESQYSVAQGAWFASSQFAGSGRWLTSPVGVIQPPTLTLSDSVFHVALRMRLLLDLSVHHDGDISPERCRCDQLSEPSEPLHVLDEPANKTALSGASQCVSRPDRKSLPSAPRYTRVRPGTRAFQPEQRGTGPAPTCGYYGKLEGPSRPPRSWTLPWAQRPDHSLALLGSVFSPPSREAHQVSPVRTPPLPAFRSHR
jgi:hypothetical protein